MPLVFRIAEGSDVEISMSSDRVTITVGLENGAVSTAHGVQGTQPAPFAREPSLDRESFRAASAPLAREILINDAIEELIQGRLAVPELAYQALLFQLRGQGLPCISLPAFKQRLRNARKHRHLSSSANSDDPASRAPGPFHNGSFDKAHADHFPFGRQLSNDRNSGE